MSVATLPAHLQITTGEFLTAIYNGEPDGHISLLTRDKTGRNVRILWAANINEVRDIARRLCDNHDIWFSVAPRTKPLGTDRGSVTDCVHLPALWVDIDFANQGHDKVGLPEDMNAGLDLLEAMPLQPSALIHTGGGIQAWWILDEPAKPEEAIELLTKWGGTWATLAERQHVAIDNVFDLTRAMRLPNTQNWKLDHPRPVHILGWDPTRRYGLDEIEPVLLDPPTPPVELNQPRVPYIGPKRPGDHFNATVTPQHVLKKAGWTFNRSNRDGDEHWTRPGKDPKQGSSATIFAADQHTTIWSDAPSLPPALQTRRPYDTFGLHVALNHNGNFTAATQELVELGYGERTITETDLLSWVANNTPTVPNGTAEEPDDNAHLPEQFWDAHPLLTHIKQAAQSRLVAPDAVFAATLTRIAALTPHTLDIPGVIGSPVGLTTYVALVGPPEAGKSAAAAIAAELLPAPPGIHDRTPIGSGEGFVDILFSMVTEPDDKGNKRRVKRQTTYAAIFHIDEGAVLTDLGQRSGSTLLPALRTAYSHGTLGNANASEERKRILEGHKYVYGVTLGIQPELAGPLLDDHTAGTPQRFIWIMATDPHAPDITPEWPGQLDWTPPGPKQLEKHLYHRANYRRQQFNLHPDIIQTLQDERRAVLKGETVKDSLDAHQRLVQLKTAGLLALLDNTLDIELHHWALAEQIIGTSRAVRESIERTLQRVASDKQRAADDRLARRELHIQGAREAEAIDRAARIVARAVARHADRDTHEQQGGGCVRKCLHEALGRRYREMFTIEEIIDEAVSFDWIREQNGRWIPGESRPA